MLSLFFNISTSVEQFFETPCILFRFVVSAPDSISFASSGVMKPHVVSIN